MTVFQSVSRHSYNTMSSFPTVAYSSSSSAYTTPISVPSDTRSCSKGVYAERMSIDTALIQNLIKLHRIGQLQDNWNGYHAKPLPSLAVDNARTLLLRLPKQPFISPTGRDSIQFEYEKANGDYFEVEVFDKTLTIYMDIAGSESKRSAPCDNTGYSMVKEGVEYFYGQQLPR